MHCLFSLTNGFSIEKSGASGWADDSGRLLSLWVWEEEEKIRKASLDDVSGRVKIALKHTRAMAMIGVDLADDLRRISFDVRVALLGARGARVVGEKEKSNWSQKDQGDRKKIIICEKYVHHDEE